VVADQVDADRVQSRSHGGQLGEDILTLLVLFDHSTETSYLPLNASQPVDETSIVVTGYFVGFFDA
jgi:hypothetical protein